MKMRELFRGYYRPSDEDFNRIWNEGIIVLDANVLLNLYRYPSHARDAVERVLHLVGDRLWVPHQAALEYQRNRLAVIAEQLKKYGEVTAILEAIRTEARKLTQLQLERRHSAIDPKPFLEAINGACDAFSLRLKEAKDRQRDVHQHDELRDRIDGLLTGKIGKAPKNQAELDELFTKGKERYDLHVPPGYLDAEGPKDKREATYTHDGLLYKPEFGDWLIWNALLERVSEEDVACVLFVTDDQTEDWWQIVESNGKKTIGPRPELIAEALNSANLEVFYMYTTENFIKYAKEYLGAEVESETIEQVRAATDPRSFDPIQSVSEEDAIGLLVNHLSVHYPGDYVTTDPVRADVVRHNGATNHKTAYHVVAVYDPELEIERAPSLLALGAALVASAYADSYALCYVVHDLIYEDFHYYLSDIDLPAVCGIYIISYVRRLGESPVVKGWSHWGAVDDRR